MSACATCGGSGWERLAEERAVVRCACNSAPTGRELRERSRKARRSRRKGVEAERELAAWLRGFGIDARRGAQRQGGPDTPDVVAALPFHVECKRVERLNVGRAVEQAERDAAGGPAVVFYRSNRAPWRVVLDAATFLELLGHRRGEERARAASEESDAA